MQKPTAANVALILTPSERAVLLEAISAQGMNRVAAWIGCSRDALSGAAAGIRTRRGTLALIRRATFDRLPARREVG
jgi:hypothetical protein